MRLFLGEKNALNIWKREKKIAKVANENKEFVKE
jgi:hypothetical protein